MNRPLCRRAIALAALLTAAGAPVFAGKPEPEKIPRDALMKAITDELVEIRGKISALPVENAADAEMKSNALAIVTRTEFEFKKRVNDVKDKTNYAIEAQYLGEAFFNLVVKPTSEAVAILQDRRKTSEQRMHAFDASRSKAKSDERKSEFDREFYTANKEEVDAVVLQRRKENNPDGDRNPFGYGRPGQGNWSQGDGMIGMRRFISKSPLIIAGTESVTAAYEAVGSGNGGGAPNNGIPGTGSGNTTVGNPGNTTGGGGSAPNGDHDGDQNNQDNQDNAWSNISLGGVSQAPQTIANGAGQALKSGDYGQALSLAQLALQFDPKNKDALGVLYSAKGRTAGEAAGASAMGAADASAFNPSGGPDGVGGGARGGFESPSASMSRSAGSAALRAASEQAYGGAGNLMRLGDDAGALDILSKALSQNPDNPKLLNMRAMAYAKLGRWEEALRDAKAGLELAPGNEMLLGMKARAENRLHRYDDALATANLMIAKNPRSAWGYAYRAHAQAGLGNREAMLADINQAAELDSHFRQAAADAALLQLPSDADVLFLFPGESAKDGAKAPAAAAPGRGRSFGVVVGAGLVSGLLLALGLLSTVLAPVKETVVSAFTRVKRTGPAAAAAVTAELPSAAASAGGLIRGQYEILRQIGAGGMGMVYEGTDRSLGRRVAIKKMRDELRLNPRERDRFIIEAKTVASLHHPNIVDIYAIAEEGEDVYLVFEYVDGKTVHDLVQSKGRLDASEAVKVARAMGEALTYAHSRGVIHRDMKPSNVMLTGAGQIKVMDFGIARMAKDAATRYSMTNNVVGTPPYMAPEQEQGVVRKESDVYSLAICAYEMLTGKLPFIGIGAGMLMNKINMSYIPPSRNIAGLPESLDEVFLKAFQADPERRYRTPQEFVAALDAAANGSRSKAS